MDANVVTLYKELCISVHIPECKAYWAGDWAQPQARGSQVMPALAAQMVLGRDVPRNQKLVRRLPLAEQQWLLLHFPAPPDHTIRYLFAFDYHSPDITNRNEELSSI